MKPITVSDLIEIRDRLDAPKFPTGDVLILPKQRRKELKYLGDFFLSCGFVKDVHFMALDDEESLYVINFPKGFHE